MPKFLKNAGAKDSASLRAALQEVDSAIAAEETNAVSIEKRYAPALLESDDETLKKIEKEAQDSRASVARLNARRAALVSRIGEAEALELDERNRAMHASALRDVDDYHALALEYGGHARKVVTAVDKMAVLRRRIEAAKAHLAAHNATRHLVIPEIGQAISSRTDGAYGVSVDLRLVLPDERDPFGFYWNKQSQSRAPEVTNG